MLKFGKLTKPSKLNKMDEPLTTADLTRERHLWDVVRACQELRDSPLNLSTTVLVFAALMAWAILSHQTPASLAVVARGWADSGLNFATAILGFLLAGFTIFATFTRVELFTRMTFTRHEVSGFSYMKHNYLTFMKVFVVYLGFVLISILVKLFLVEHGAIISITNLPSPSGRTFIREYIARLGIASYGAYFWYMAILMQSFIFNVYHSVMTNVRWDVERHVEQAPEDKG